MEQTAAVIDWNRTPVQMIESVLRANMFRIVGRYYNRLRETLAEQKATAQGKEVETITIPELAASLARRIKPVLDVLNPVKDQDSWKLAADAIERSLVSDGALTIPAERHHEWQSFSGEQIRRLMRQNDISIRELAERMQITMIRVREVRERGVTGNCYCRDWYEAITSTGIYTTQR